MNYGFGAENQGTPVGDRSSLEQKAKEINDRERQKFLAEIKQKHGEEGLQRYLKAEQANKADKSINKVD
jgi:hypothetical protein